MKNNRLLLLLSIFVFFLSYVNVQASVVSCQLLYEHYESPSNLSGRIRLLAEDSAKSIVTRHLNQEDDNIDCRQQPISTAGLLHYRAYNTDDDTLYIYNEKPLHFLISYHYRKDGKLPLYKPDIFTDSWVQRVLDLTDISDVNTICLVVVLNEQMMTSLHLVERRKTNLMEKLQYLNNTFSLFDITCMPDEIFNIDDKIGELLDLLRELQNY